MNGMMGVNEIRNAIWAACGKEQSLTSHLPIERRQLVAFLNFFSSACLATFISLQPGVEALAYPMFFLFLVRGVQEVSF